MTRFAAACLCLALAGCNAVLGLDERGRATDGGDEVEDSSVVANDTAEPLKDTFAPDDTSPLVDTGTRIDTGNAIDTGGMPPIDTGTPMMDTGVTCPGTVCAGGGCTNTKVDPRNCGMCGKRCNDAEYCSDGTCRCRPGAISCFSTCVEVNASRCTACATSCGGLTMCNVASRTCVSICPTGTTLCSSGAGNVCVDKMTSAFHCGDCNKGCNFDQVCAAGSCRSYRPAVGCVACPCSSCDVGEKCCPGLPGQTSPMCVQGASC